MSNKFKSFVFAALGLLAIPLIGLLIGYNISSKYESEFVSAIADEYKVSTSKVEEVGLSLTKLCADNKDSALNEVCGYVDNINLLIDASLATLAIGIVLLLSIFLLKQFIGLSRTKLAILFNPIATLSIVVISISTLLQGAILVYGFYIAEVVYTKQYHPKIVFLIGLGALIATFALFKAAFSALEKKPMYVNAEKITKENGSKLIKLVDDLAHKIGAAPPNNILLGLEPNFYVTAAQVAIAETGEVLKGTTMYLSLPFLNILSENELAAVIGHELGHFKGEDTVYSMRFYPPYTKLYNAMSNLQQQNEGGSQALFASVALAPLALILAEFATTERTIGRTRELEADRTSATVNGGQPLISSLLKISEYSPIWSELRMFNIDTLNEGNVFKNLANLFTDASEKRFDKLDFSDNLEQLLTTSQSHPTDTHPTISERMQSLGVKIEEISKELLKPSNTKIENYLNNPNEINEKLTVQEHRLMIAYGYVNLPQEEEVAD